jgi:hypothetical protein
MKKKWLLLVAFSNNINFIVEMCIYCRRVLRREQMLILRQAFELGSYY